MFHACRRVAVVAAAGVLGAVGTVHAEPIKALDPSVTVIRDVTVLTMTERGALKNHCVVVRDGRIDAVKPAAEVGAIEGARVIDGTGRVLMPGLADLHVHFPPFVGETGDASWRMVTLMLCNGVTTARGMQGHPTHLELRRRLIEGTLLGPTSNMGSPAVTVQAAGSPEAAETLVQSHAKAGYDAIKSHRVVSPDIHAAVIRAAAAAKVPVTGHVDNEVGLSRVLGTGQQIEHLDGYFAELLKQPELANQFGQVVPAGISESFDLSKTAEVAKRIADAKVWSGPTMALFRNLALAHEPADAWRDRPELRYISAGAKAQWLAQRTGLAQPQLFGNVEHSKWFIDARAGMLRSLRDAGGRLLLCSDSPQAFLVAGFAAHDELAAMVGAGLKPEEALRAGTTEAAAYFASLINRGSALGIDPDFGTIEVGKRADLLLLREDPRTKIEATRSIEAVVIRGKVLDRATLDSMLEKVAESARAAG